MHLPGAASLPDNFVRAESDLAFAKVVKGDGFGKFNHDRELSPLDKQLVARQNRDTLYSTAVFDMKAGDVTITMPDPGKRFMTLITIDEDHYVVEVVYGAGRHVYTPKKVGTRYLFAAVRILVDPADPRMSRRFTSSRTRSRLTNQAGRATLKLQIGIPSAKRRCAMRCWCSTTRFRICEGRAAGGVRSIPSDT